MQRKKIVAGNWKMNLSLNEAELLANEIAMNLDKNSNTLTIIIPPFVYLHHIGKIISHHPILLGAQNCHTENTGAFTGEVSASMLASVDCKYVLVGHSERRIQFKESSSDLVLKIKKAIANGLNPIFCIGETLEERKLNTHFEIVTKQLQDVLSHFTLKEFELFIIAYEPVWAIGTGETATPIQAQEMHSYIRSVVTDIYDSSIANSVSILYGGSCNPQNAEELFKCPDIDGGLIGGASLKADEFCKIIASF